MEATEEEQQLEELIPKAQAIHCSDDVIDLAPDPKLASIRVDTKAVGKVLSWQKQSKLVVRNGLVKARSEIPVWFMQEGPNICTII